MAKKKVYLSGRITGLPYDIAKGVFNAYQRYIEQNWAEEYEVVNPMMNGLPRDADWATHMRADIKLLMDCSEIYMLPNWVESRGATIERRLAEDLEMVIHYAK